MRRVLITGANRGIGLGFARHYAESGWSVIAACRSPSKSEGLQGLREDNENLDVEPLDVSSPASISELCSNLERRRWTVDLLISNAGVLLNELPGSWTRQGFMNTFSVNAVGPAILFQSLEGVLAPRAKVIQLSSGLGSLEWGGEGMSDGDAYAMSKAALNMLTVRLASQPSNRSRVIVSMSPGWVRTDMGGSGANLSVEDSVEAMTATIESLTTEDSGGFLDNRGNTIPW